METLALRSSSTVAKVVGTVVSISGAFVLVLYKGSPILGASQVGSQSLHLRGSVSDCAVGAFLLSAEYIFISFWYIIQAQVMEVYPEELVAVFFYNLFATLISIPTCLIAETNLRAWRLTDTMAFAATLYTGLLESSLGTLVHTWGLQQKGPVYVALFKPLSIAIAAAMGIVFLGDTLYLGSVVGAFIVSVGFYVAIWGKASEENEEGVGIYTARSMESQSHPLLEEGDLSEVII